MEATEKTVAAPVGPDADGIYVGLIDGIYRRAPGASVSSLKYLDPPARFPNRKHEPPTAAMRMGTLVHSLILEPDKPLPRIVLKPTEYPADHPQVLSGKVKAGTELKWSASHWCKAWAKAQEDAGNDVMTEKEWETLNACVEAVANDEMAAAILSEGFGEVSWFSTLELPSSRRTVRRKGRIDWASPGRRFLADVKKVSEDGGRREFWEANAWDRRYYVQAAYYLDGWNEQADAENQVEKFIFIVVESEPPYLVSKFEIRVGDELYEAGRSQYLQDLETLMECKATGVWPGYLPGVQPMGMPGFARRKLRK